MFLISFGMVVVALLYEWLYAHPVRVARRLIRIAEKFPGEFYVPDPYAPFERTIVFVGDSLFFGAGVADFKEGIVGRIVCKLSDPLTPTLVDNLSRPGARLLDLEEQLEVVRNLRRRPLTLVILIGSNDATHFTSVKQFRRELQRTLASLWPLDIEVYIATCPDFSYVPALHGFGWVINRRVKRFNEVIRKCADDDPRLQLIDLYEYKLRDRNLYAPDGFHPNEKGYEIWFDAFWPLYDASVPTAP